MLRWVLCKTSNLSAWQDCVILCGGAVRDNVEGRLC
jgi:hypothetical protein